MRDDESIGLFAQTACLWEATARKPGNVHPQAEFEDLHYLDFCLSALAIGPVLAASPRQTVGRMVLEGIRRTREVVRTNTNLGILLLLAPLARASPGGDFRGSLLQVLDDLTVADAENVYEAIRQAGAGGLGQVSEEDVHDRPTRPLREVMGLAADRDLIARQYANGFKEVLDEGLPALERALEETGTLEGAVIGLHLRLLAAHPDSLIQRKRGLAEAEEVSDRARMVLTCRWPHTTEAWSAFRELDAWLREQGHSRNPGTTADLVAACLFVALRMEVLRLPCQYPWPLGFPK